MYRGHEVAVVVPAYNEEGFVGDVIDTVPPFVDKVYAVDDCSTDGTWPEICEHAAEANAEQVPAPTATGTLTLEHEAHGDPFDTDDRVVPIRHERNRGVGAAIKTGYRLALSHDADVVAVMNGDGQMDPAMLDRLLDPVVSGRADYAKGNRLRRRTDRMDMSRWRTFGNFLLTYLTRIASGYWETMDPQNGYTVVSKTVLETVDLDELYDRYGFCNDMLVHLNVHGFRVADVPMQAIYGDETSHIRYASFVPLLSKLLFQRYVHRLSRRYRGEDGLPVTSLHAVGALGVLAGVGLTVAGAFVGGVRTLAFVALLAGAAVFGLGMAADRRANRSLAIRIDATEVDDDGRDVHPTVGSETGNHDGGGRS